MAAVIYSYITYSKRSKGFRERSLMTSLVFWPFLTYLPTYSSVPNRRACTFINFEEKIPPARPYLALHVYCF